MWFHQITCDTCFTVMTEITRSNRYYFADIVEKVIFCDNNSYNKTERLSDNSLYLHVNGNGLSYRIKTSSFVPDNWCTFCCMKCAFAYAKKRNKVLMFFDEDLFTLSLIMPDTGGGDEKPILVPEWPEWEWFCQFYDVINLSAFGTNSTFPEFILGDINLLEPTRTSTESLFNMVYAEDFMVMYFGSYERDFAESRKRAALSELDKNTADFQINFGRRAQIDWHIHDMNGIFVGFVHLTKLYHAIPGEWVLEFGLLPTYEHRGIMTRSINEVLTWAKQQGCTDIYAVSEIYNEGSHSIFKKLKYQVEITQNYMSDEHSGFRLMYNYHVSL